MWDSSAACLIVTDGRRNVEIFLGETNGPSSPVIGQPTSLKRPAVRGGGGASAGGESRFGEIALKRQIDRRVALARLVLWWEDLWPRLVWPVGVAAGFVALSWLGLWSVTPDPWRIGLLCAFAVALLAALTRLRGLRWPSRGEALARVEDRSGYPHRPLQTIEDSLPEGADQVARAMWSAHRERIRSSVGDIKVGLPAPGVARADRYGLRVVLAMALFVGFLAAGDGRFDRIAAAFRAPAGAARPESRLDAWVTPPNYTGKRAILLSVPGGPPAEPDGTIRVPQGSQLVIRSSVGDPQDAKAVAVALVQAGKTTMIAAKAPDQAAGDAVPPETSGALPVAAAASGSSEFGTTLAAAAEVRVTNGTSMLADWRFSVDPDAPPTIKFVGKPEAQLSGTLKLTYEIADDYGVVGADAHFEPGPDSVKITTNASSLRPLISAPDFALSLPAGRAKSGQAQTFRDLTAHPWAGAKVRLTLAARDEANQEGRSETIDVVLPEKVFTKPLARALIEQRRILALDANRVPQVGDAVDALLFAPEHFFEDSGSFLGVSKVYRDLKAAKSDDDLRKVVDLLWQVATGIEDGNLSQAEKAVRDAEEALRKALENGASDKDIAKLTQDLRDALEKYVRELAEAARNNPQARPPENSSQRMLRQQDLNKMLDKIEQLAKTGSRDAARQMLSEMQRMLENLRAGRGQDQNGEQGQANDTLDKLGEMIQRQQQLMDKTHRLDRRGSVPRDGTPGADKPMTKEELQQALKDLEKNQGELRQALKDMKDRIGKQGLGKPKPGGKGQKADPQGEPGEAGADGEFGKADDAMGDAKDALGEGETGDAVDAQGRALDRLREGARKLVDEMAQQQNQGQRPGSGQVGDTPGDDPLGRPRRREGPDLSNTVKVPGEIDVQRARRILEDIRRRLSEPMRPRLELDYLERLLKGE